MITLIPIALIASLLLLPSGSAEPAVTQTQPAAFAALSTAFALILAPAALQRSPAMFAQNIGRFDEPARFRMRGDETDLAGRGRPPSELRATYRG